ncbi:alpha/beta-hydrolases superfamily protein [Klebsormidium nitens]|uniref:Alpha/beta-hydrolases superfamily protein n=1 Tax=Klebsormidium nitens TaxID=105231 RepID=A0A1Y1HZ11_KLENI|nr:alpha/beta-hydrolases superfamily protein [Klebsormidium nitens]|eukprot:GAQ83423.1 alpha/beta-hydrolases superfamily protein [Klebsormidium nitens]
MNPGWGDKLALCLGGLCSPCGGCLGTPAVRMYGKYLKKQFNKAGLVEEQVDIDGGETSMHMWVPKKFADARKGGRTIEQQKQPPVVLLHAFGPGAIWHWNAQVKDFCKRLDVFIPDLPFFGESTSRSNQRSETWEAECVKKALDQYGVTTFDAVGISYGGFVGYRLAQLYPNNLRKVCLTDSPGVVVTKEEWQNVLKDLGLKDMLETLLPDNRKDMRAGIGLTFHKPPPVPGCILDGALKVMFGDGLDERRELVEHLMRFLDNPESPLGRYRQECLLVWGEFDRVFPLPLGQKLKAFLGPSAELVVIKKGGHQPSVEMPKEYNKIVLDWLTAEPKVMTEATGKPVVEADGYTRNPGSSDSAAETGEAIAAEKLDGNRGGLAEHMETSLGEARAPAGDVELARQTLTS